MQRRLSPAEAVVYALVLSGCLSFLVYAFLFVGTDLTSAQATVLTGIAVLLAYEGLLLIYLSG